MEGGSTASKKGERRDWRLLWLSSIQAFADGYTQRTRWPNSTEQNSQVSFADCMSSYFADADLAKSGAYDRRLEAGQVSPAEIAAVAKFHSLAECYESPDGDDRNSQAILRDPKWQEVVAAARDAQQQLLPLLTNETERDALTKPLYGRELVDTFSADLSSTPAAVSDRAAPRPMFERLGLREFILTKPISPSAAHIPADVRRQLTPLGFRADKNEGRVIYSIGPFALSRFNSVDSRSMFAAFTEVVLQQEGGLWVLRLKLNKAIWLVFVIFPLVLLAMRPLSSIGLREVLEAIAIPAALVAGSLLWVGLRLSRWWRGL